MSPEALNPAARPVCETGESKFEKLRGSFEKLRAELGALRNDIGEVRATLAGMAKELQFLRWSVLAIVAILLAEFVGKFFP